jgi:hypothetical protein
MAKLSKKQQDEQIEEEIKRYNHIFKYLQEDKKQVAQRLIERVAFMTVTLQILEDTIKTKGPTYTFINGSQRMVVENPAQKSYNAMINRYTSAYEKLFALLPKEGGLAVEDETDGFDEFVNDRCRRKERSNIHSITIR